jgi:hypothetical protein
MNATAAIKQGAVLAAVVAGLGVVAGGCLTRPLATGEPALKTNFTVSVTNSVIDKVDLLFDIDNSASMGDKQQYLIQAIPDLINRLVNPNCVDAMGNFVSNSTGGNCPGGSGAQLEFPPVHDMHLGIVTSALGMRLGDLCDPTATAAPSGQPFAGVSAHNDDQGHLIARSLTYNAGMTDATEGTVAKAVVQSYMPSPSGFLWWYPAAGAPPGPVSPETNANTLITDFGSMVGGVGIWGCGIESQLESWYRFLVQPDPYASLTSTASSPVGMWNGVDTQILQQRKDFLRPDSLVAVIVLTDENDSEIDVRSLNGQGYYFMSSKFAPPKGTSKCASNPADPACVSCSVNSSDSACSNPGGKPAYQTYSALNDWGYDPNLRHVHMKAKYGVDPQYPIGRYVIGLKSTLVPDRFGEYQDAQGNATGNYLGRNDCTNPLYAASLPDGSDLSAGAICNMQVGVRTPDRVFFAIIGGVPHELLHFDPTSAANSTLNDNDWVRILGRGPAGQTPTSASSYDYNGIDPHMIEDYRDRTTVNYGFSTDTSLTNALVASNSGMTDPVNGREWVTDMENTAGTHVLHVDREYACTFKLPTARDCTAAANQNACDCPATPTGLSAAQLPPLCDPANPTHQVAAKAYPTVRELMVARMMGIQGIVSSLCPIDVSDNADKSDPLYGYRPAVAVIVDRLKNALNTKCLPYKLQANPDMTVPCLVLVKMPPDGSSSCLNPACDKSQGLIVPVDQNVLQQFCAQEETAWANSGKAGTDPATQSVCQLNELVNTGGGDNGMGVNGNPADFDSNGQCSTNTSGDKGWCYAENVKGCAQSIEFATGSPPPGGVAALQCIFASGDGGM